MRWCALEGLYTGSVEWGECAGRHSGTSAHLGKVVFWRTPGNWENAGSVSWVAGVVVCGGGVVYRLGGAGRVGSGALARLRSWEGWFLVDSGELGNAGECEPGWLGAVVCGGEITYRLGGLGESGGGILARLRAWGV